MSIRALHLKLATGRFGDKSQVLLNAFDDTSLTLEIKVPMFFFIFWPLWHYGKGAIFIERWLKSWQIRLRRMFLSWPQQSSLPTSHDKLIFVLSSTYVWSLNHLWFLQLTDWFCIVTLSIFLSNKNISPTFLIYLMLMSFKNSLYSILVN